MAGHQAFHGSAAAGVVDNTNGYLQYALEPGSEDVSNRPHIQSDFGGDHFPILVRIDPVEVLLFQIGFDMLGFGIGVDLDVTEKRLVRHRSFKLGLIYPA